MNVDYLSAFQTLPVRNRSLLEAALVNIFKRLSESDPVPVKAVRDNFSSFNNRAKAGHVQLVRGSPGEETVIVSVRDLATMLQSAAATLSLDDVLVASGFKAAEGGRIDVGERFERDASVELR